jgi:undecaprenyl-diphosphatase
VIAALVVTAVGLAIFTMLTVVIAGHPGPTGLDSTVLHAVDDLNGGAGVAAAKVVSLLGTLPVTAAVALAVAFSLRHRPAALVGLVGAVIAIYVTVHVTKAATDRPRPPNPLAGSTLSAFPSGHSAYSTIYVAVALLSRRAILIAAATALALAVGASRLYLRVHWATDVLGGWALGAAIFGAATAVAVVVSRLRNNDGHPIPWP